MNKHVLNQPSCANCDRENDLFCALNKSEKEHLSDTKRMNFYKKGQVIFYDNHFPYCLYCIHDGKVKVTKMGDQGKEQIVRLAGPGDLLGYRAVLSGEKYRGSAIAIEDSYICALSKDKFFELLENNPKLSINTIQLLTKDLRQSEQKLASVVQKTVKERLAETLLMLKERFGVSSGGTILDVHLTRREIGDIAGMTTETVIRTLSDFNKEKIVRLNGKKIELLDIPRLALMANLED
ncbi:Crp/Fnr family transcriptional regulator [Fulvivirgaceae bacterium BMA10]|uniref:Crp/Fnr family transcriptional regulator n=1 Tax=Splendidivirga corallicola TaxID=3051826 RepID=A0ABT8KMV1_9BACT|nr:Crp/Fnr family transcriptional regulator [Fulvivirgaceae bacterium BMA10]